MPKKIEWYCTVSFKSGIRKRMVVSAFSMWGAEANVRKVLSIEHTADELKRMGEYEIRCRAKQLPTDSLSSVQGVQGVLSEEDQGGTAEDTGRGVEA